MPSRWRGGEELAHAEQAGGVEEIPGRHEDRQAVRRRYRSS